MLELDVPGAGVVVVDVGLDAVGGDRECHVAVAVGAVQRPMGVLDAAEADVGAARSAGQLLADATVEQRQGNVVVHGMFLPIGR